VNARPAGAAIAGLGMTDIGKVFGRGPRRLAAEAVRLAAADAGLDLAEVDGLLACPGISGQPGTGLARDLGLRDLRLLSQVNVLGASAGAAISIAAMAVTSGTATAVACVFADTPLREDAPAGAAFGAAGVARERTGLTGLSGLARAFGFGNVTAHYALAARRHMTRFGTTSEQLGAIAVSQRQWAAGNPLAERREPIAVSDHQASRWIADPLHLLDCCLVSNGAIAVVVTTAERAAVLRRPPVYVWGWGQGHPGYRMARGSDFGLVTGAAMAGPAAMGMAGIGPGDVTMCQLYDCYTYTVLVSLEDYGFCAKGEGGVLAASGELGPDGSLPVNTGGGQLSGYYMWGFTPLSEAVIQARGDGGKRQSTRTDIILVSGNGGILDHHAALILSPHPASSPGPFSSASPVRTGGPTSPAGLVSQPGPANCAGPVSSPGPASPARLPPDPASAAPSTGSPPSAPGTAPAERGRAGTETGIITRDERSAPFFDAAARETLLIKRCQACDIWLAPEAGGCPDCGAGRPGWAPASGRGTLISWAVIHPRPAPAGPPAAAGQTVLALVELEEGPWLHTRLETIEPGALQADVPVRAHFAHPPAGDSYPYFKPGARPGSDSGSTSPQGGTELELLRDIHSRLRDQEAV
jgi:acetyl-CoA acetyltransferase/uncharacterized OB-fold protein